MRYVLGAALLMMLFFAGPEAGAKECSVLGSERPIHVSAAGLTKRNEFLQQVCGEPDGDIYDLFDPMLKGRIQKPARGELPRAHVYSDEAREKGYEGKVMLAAIIETDGSIKHVTVLESSGCAELDVSGIPYVLKLKFASPATLDGQPIRVMIYYPITFKLTSGFKHLCKP